MNTNNCPRCGMTTTWTQGPHGWVCAMPGGCGYGTERAGRERLEADANAQLEADEYPGPSGMPSWRVGCHWKAGPRKVQFTDEFYVRSATPEGAALIAREFRLHPDMTVAITPGGDPGTGVGQSDDPDTPASGPGHYDERG